MAKSIASHYCDSIEFDTLAHGGLTEQMPELNDIQRQFILAAIDLTVRQRELYDRLLSLRPRDPYEIWMLGRLGSGPQGLLEELARISPVEYERLTQSDEPLGGEWNWHCHGFELDFDNVHDGRHVRIDYGTNRFRLALSGYGVMLFVLTTTSPWNEYPALAAHLSKCPPPYSRYAYRHDRMSEIENVLVSLGYFRCVDQTLVNLRQQFTVRDKNSGHSLISIPERLKPTPHSDIFVCDRLLVTERAYDEFVGKPAPP